MPDQFNDIADFRGSANVFHLIAEHPLLSAHDAVFHVFLENDLFFHVGKVDSFGARSNTSDWRSNNLCLQERERFDIFLSNGRTMRRANVVHHAFFESEKP